MASAPIKLKLKLGGGSTAASTSAAGAATINDGPTSTSSSSSNNQPGQAVASNQPRQPATGARTSSSAATPPDTLANIVLPKLKALPQSAPASDAGSTTADAAATSAPKPKRKRAPKRPAGEPGPGKAWRKGLKGTIVAGQLDASQLPSAASASGVASASMSRTGSNATAIAGPSATMQGVTTSSSRVSTGWSSSTIQDYRTPRPRKWQRHQQEITTVTGKTIKIKSWVGGKSLMLVTETHSLKIVHFRTAPVSLYAEWRKNRPAVATTVGSPAASTSGTSAGTRTSVPIRQVPTPARDAGRAQAAAAVASIKNSPVEPAGA
ncbi:hypothetical protein ACM66B_001708 [Microbotryomycetes sp. NB124-2]